MGNILGVPYFLYLGVTLDTQQCLGYTIVRVPPRFLHGGYVLDIPWIALFLIP